MNRVGIFRTMNVVVNGCDSFPATMVGHDCTLAMVISRGTVSVKSRNEFLYSDRKWVVVPAFSMVTLRGKKIRLPSRSTTSRSLQQTPLKDDGGGAGGITRTIGGFGEEYPNACVGVGSSPSPELRMEIVIIVPEEDAKEGAKKQFLCSRYIYFPLICLLSKFRECTQRSLVGAALEALLGNSLREAYRRLDPHTIPHLNLETALHSLEDLGFETELSRAPSYSRNSPDDNCETSRRIPKRKGDV